MDTDGSLSISVDEFRQTLRDLKVPITEEQLKELIKVID
jgi:Ca2+-binding EF-hand superfamily protein